MKPFMAFLVVSLINHSTPYDPTSNIEDRASSIACIQHRILFSSRRFPLSRCRSSSSFGRFVRTSSFLARKSEERGSYCTPWSSTKNSYYRVTLFAPEEISLPRARIELR